MEPSLLSSSPPEHRLIHFSDGAQQPSQLTEDDFHERPYTTNLRDADNHNPVLSYDARSGRWSQTDIMDPDAFFFSNCGSSLAAAGEVPKQTSHLLTPGNSLEISKGMPFSNDTSIHRKWNDYLYDLDPQLQWDLQSGPEIGDSDLESPMNHSSRPKIGSMLIRPWTGSMSQDQVLISGESGELNLSRNRFQSDSNYHVHCQSFQPIIFQQPSSIYRNENLPTRKSFHRRRPSFPAEDGPAGVWMLSTDMQPALQSVSEVVSISSCTTARTLAVDNTIRNSDSQSIGASEAKFHAIAEASDWTVYVLKQPELYRRFPALEVRVFPKGRRGTTLSNPAGVRTGSTITLGKYPRSTFSLPSDILPCLPAIIGAEIHKVLIQHNERFRMLLDCFECMERKRIFLDMVDKAIASPWVAWVESHREFVTRSTKQDGRGQELRGESEQILHSNFGGYASQRRETPSLRSPLDQFPSILDSSLPESEAVSGGFSNDSVYHYSSSALAYPQTGTAPDIPVSTATGNTR